MAKQKGKIIKTVFNIVAWILVLSAFGVTLRDILAFDWMNTIGNMLITFFTL